MFSSHQSSSVNILSDDLPAAIHLSRLSQQRTNRNITPPLFTQLSSTSSASSRNQPQFPSPFSVTCWYHSPVPGRETNSLVGRNFFFPAGSSSSLLYLRDTLSSERFLVDSRASVFFLPAPALFSNSGIGLVTPNGSAMSCSGSRIAPLQFRSKHNQWTFQQAHVSIPILGAYFLCRHHILVRVAGEHLLKLCFVYVDIILIYPHMCTIFT